jgi:hypothetical protein
VIGGVQVVECAKINGGTRPILEKVPDTAGVYAWFKSFSPPDPHTATPDEFFQYLIKETSLPHFIPRSAPIRPVYRVKLSSHRQYSEAKSALLRSLCNEAGFRKFIADLLRERGLIFQQPLYIGKADPLRGRVEAHLTGRTPLLRRLDTVGINLLCCTLVYVEVPTFVTDLDTSLQIEELLSKLFCPPFTVRYG